MFQYSKHTFGCQVSDKTDPNKLGFLFLDKLRKNCGAIILKLFKRLSHGFCSILSKIEKPTRLWFTKDHFEYWNIFRDICRLRFLKNNFELLINHYFSVNFYIFSSERNGNRENFGNTFETLLDIISKCSCV